MLPLNLMSPLNTGITTARISNTLATCLRLAHWNSSLARNGAFLFLSFRALVKNIPLILKMKKKEEMRLLFLTEFELGHNLSQTAANINWSDGEGTSLEDQSERIRPPAIDNEHQKTLGRTSMCQRNVSDNGWQHFNKIRPSQEYWQRTKLDIWFPQDLIVSQRVWHFKVCSMLPLQNSNYRFRDRMWWEMNPLWQS